MGHGCQQQASCYKPLIGEQLSAYRSVRSDEVVLSRLRLGHSYLTHSYLLKGEPPPECVACNCRLTISHILVDCFEYIFFRLILFENNFTSADLFNNVSPNKIVVVVDLPLLHVAVEGSDNPISLEKPCQASLPPDQQGHHSLGRHPEVQYIA